MIKQSLAPALVVLGALAVASPCAAEDAAPAEASAPSVAALAWMTGVWAGPAGPGELEENWTTPKAGSIQALVRMTAGGKTSMVEVIVIEEEEGTLRLRLQQWDPGFKPRTPGPMVFELTELGDNTVAFKAVSEGAQMSTLRYTRDGESFTIGIRFGEGAPEVRIALKARPSGALEFAAQTLR